MEGTSHCRLPGRRDEPGGNVVHNLRRIDSSRPGSGFDWAQDFDVNAATIMTSTPAELLRLQDRDNFRMAAPTPDHFIPLLYLAGLASAAGDTADVLVDGHAMGSLSMASYTLGSPELDPPSQGGSPALPHVPADETNI